MTSPEFSWAPEGTLSGWPQKLFLRIVKRPECIRTFARRFFPPQNEAGAAVSGIICRRNVACRHRNDGQPRDPGRGSRGPTRTIRAVAACCSSNSTAPSRKVEALMSHVNEICRSNGRVGNSPGAVGRGTRARLERTQGRLCGDGAHLTQLHRPGRRHFRATALPRVMSEIGPPQPRSRTACGKCVSRPGDGNLHPLVSVRPPNFRPGRSSPNSFRTIFSNCASPRAARSPANTALAKTKRK